MAISRYLSDDHQRCDELFARAEEAVSKGRWDEADQAGKAFLSALARHFSMEEQVLFPAFEKLTGQEGGPTFVMRHEHDQMRQLMGELEQALVARDGDAVLGVTETLLILMQQHNAREEQILYPLSERLLPDPEGVVARMQGLA